MKNKKIMILILVVSLVILGALYFIPIKTEKYIKTESPMVTGGQLYKKGYNIYGIEIFDRLSKY
jgi:hypothetical protein